MKLSPDDFANTLIDDAYRLRCLAIGRGIGGDPLDQQSAIWVLTMDAWREIMRSADYSSNLDVRSKRLFGMPVRITIEDEPDTPKIQLLMEPQLQASK